MSGHYPPLTCDEVKQILKNLGFEICTNRGKGSHENYCRLSKAGLLKVTVDCPKSPFSPSLIKSMSSQAGLGKKDFYKALDKKQCAKIIEQNY